MQEFLMSHPAGPQEVVEALMQGIADQNWQDLHELYCEQAVVEHPFALPAPTRIEGHEAIRKHFANFAAAPLKLQIRNMLVRQTTDPEVIVAEWDYDGLVTTTGRVFRVSNIQVSRVRHGKIVESRDYHNHALMANVMGRLPVLVAALTEESAKPS
jgi:ketosteroid isomerase-like protein